MKLSYFKYLLSLLMFGCNGVIASYIALSSYEIVFLRTFIGSIFLLFLFLIFGNKFSFLKHKKDLFFIALSGIAMGASWMFLYEGFDTLGVGLSSLMYYSGPVIVMILSPFIFKEKLTYNKIAGFIVVVVGLLLINGEVTYLGGSSWGIFCGMMSAFTYFLLVTFNKMSKNIKGIENTVIQLIFSCLTVTLFLLFKQGLYIDFTGVNWFAVFLIGVVTTGVGCYLYFSSLSGLPVQSVAVLSYTELLSSVIFASIFLGERMTALQIVGAVLIVGGAMIGELIGITKAEKK